MSIFEAVHNIKENTDERLDTCARQFAKVLTESYPELTFWQNTPPDSEDLNKEQNDLVSDVMRQPCPDPFESCGHTLGHWLLDVYPGSMKAVQFDNKWDAPYPFNYGAAFKDAPIPQPLMRDFRADKVAIQSICDQLKKTLKPKQGRGKAKYTDYVNKAAQQVAIAVKQNGDSILSRHAHVNLLLKEFDDGDRYPDNPIHEIRFQSENDEIVEILYMSGKDEICKRFKREQFIRKVCAHL